MSMFRFCQRLLLLSVVLHTSPVYQAHGGLIGNVLGGILGGLLGNTPDLSLNYTPYYKGPVCIPSTAIQQPTSVAQVVNIVKTAIQKGRTVKAFGARHSMTDCICTDGIPVDMRGIVGMSMNPDQSVTVGSGVNLYEVAEFLKGQGRALKTTPGFGNITIGGAVGTGAHGSSFKYTSSISEQVVGVTIVDGSAKIRVITDETELLAFRVHLGLLGILVSVTLRTELLYKVRGYNTLVSDSFLLDGSFIQQIQESDQISLYWFPSFGQVVVANWTIVDVSTPGEAWTSDHVPSTYTTFNSLIVPAAEAIQAVGSVDLENAAQAMMQATLLTDVPNFAPIYTEDGVTVKNPAVGYYHRMFSPICYNHGFAQCPWFNNPVPIVQLDNEMVVDVNDVPALAKTLKDIVSEYAAAFPMQGILLRFSADTETYMSTANGRNSCHFEFNTFNRQDPYNEPALGLAAYQTIMQAILYEYGGRSHWGKSGMVYHSADNIALNLDPASKDAFLAKMADYDPQGVFLNAFGRRLKGVGTKSNTDPAVTHCALLDNCFCSTNADCALGQECGTLENYPNYQACIDPEHPLGILDPNPNWSIFVDFMNSLTPLEGGILR